MGAEMSEPQMNKLLPPETEVSRPFWDACKQGELQLQQCQSCDRLQFYPRTICSHCGGRELLWRPVSGRGKLASYTIVQRGISRAYEAPYYVVLVDLEEGVRMMSSLVECEPGAAEVGAKVEVLFQDWGEGHVLPVFRLRDE